MKRVPGGSRRGFLEGVAVVTIGLLVLSLAALPGPATAYGASSGRPDVQIGHNCREFVTFQHVDEDAARALAGLDQDADFTPTKGDPVRDGAATLFIAGRRCKKLEADGKTDHDLIESYIAVVLDPPDFAPRESRFGPVDADVLSLVPLETYLVQRTSASRSIRSLSTSIRKACGPSAWATPPTPAHPMTTEPRSEQQSPGQAVPLR